MPKNTNNRTNSRGMRDWLKESLRLHTRAYYPAAKTKKAALLHSCGTLAKVEHTFKKHREVCAAYYHLCEIKREIHVSIAFPNAIGKTGKNRGLSRKRWDTSPHPKKTKKKNGRGLGWEKTRPHKFVDGALFTSPFLTESPLPTREAAVRFYPGTESGVSACSTALYRIGVPPPSP